MKYTELANSTDTAFCGTIEAVCEHLVPKSISTRTACIGTSALIAGACQMYGWGPENPVADACSLVLGAAFLAFCSKSIIHSEPFDTKACIECVGCGPEGITDVVVV